MSRIVSISSACWTAWVALHLRPVLVCTPASLTFASLNPSMSSQGRIWKRWNPPLGMTYGVGASLYGCTGRWRWNLVAHLTIYRGSYWHISPLLLVSTLEYRKASSSISIRTKPHAGLSGFCTCQVDLSYGSTWTIGFWNRLSLNHFPRHLTGLCTMDGMASPLRFRCESLCKVPFLYCQTKGFLWFKFNYGPCHRVFESSQNPSCLHMSCCCYSQVIHKPPIGWYKDPGVHPGSSCFYFSCRNNIFILITNRISEMVQPVTIPSLDLNNLLWCRYRRTAAWCLRIIRGGFLTTLSDGY